MERQQAGVAPDVQRVADRTSDLRLAQTRRKVDDTIVSTATTINNAIVHSVLPLVGQFSVCTACSVKSVLATLMSIRLFRVAHTPGA